MARALTPTLRSAIRKLALAEPEREKARTLQKKQDEKEAGRWKKQRTEKAAADKTKADNAAYFFNIERATTQSAIDNLIAHKSSTAAAKLLRDQIRHRTIGCGLADKYSFEISVFSKLEGGVNALRTKLLDQLKRMVAEERAAVTKTALKVPDVPAFACPLKAQESVRLRAAGACLERTRQTRAASPRHTNRCRSTSLPYSLRRSRTAH